MFALNPLNTPASPSDLIILRSIFNISHFFKLPNKLLGTALTSRSLVALLTSPASSESSSRLDRLLEGRSSEGSA